MDGPRDYHTKQSKSERERQISYDIMYVESKIRHYETETDSQIQRTDLWLPGDGGGMDWGFGISRCKLVYIEWINNKVLLYSAENYVEYLVLNHNGKEYKKEYVYIYIYMYICMYV